MEMVARKSARQSQAMPPIFTVGHSTRTIAELVALLRQVAVDLLVDVRSIPRSRTNPRFNADAFAKRSLTLESTTFICPPLAVCAIEKRERCHRPIRSGGSRLSETMPIMPAWVRVVAESTDAAPLNTPVRAKLTSRAHKASFDKG